ncbi:sigma-54-dependent Fis family transcriptional regulator [Derxia lacustris]|uniref:sigma-54-dependent Fis family transcriptional regulator n=1 Tax=Derxia lacustris TaxID=764842 RepID=UPI001F1B22B4|nr:sigma-54-dependent Fis family transcriptional regulator [Derxia lacustris]
MVTHVERSRHIDNVLSAVADPAAPPAAPDPFRQSWARCMTEHGLDPARPTPARILPQQQVREHRQRLEDFLRVARSGMEDMYSRVADLGYMLLLTDASGITVDYIGNPATDDELRGAGLYLGADWNEAHAGTCGVGTCLIERRPITCHQAEHFDATHIALTCSSAPLFDPTGELLAVLDVSALRSPVGRDSQHLAFQLACLYAQRIEDANFLRHFRRHWILRLGTGPGLVDVAGETLFAFDDDALVVGANSGARSRGWGPGALPGASPVGRSLFELFPAAADAIWRLARGGLGMDETAIAADGQRRWYATVTPPRERARVGAELAWGAGAVTAPAAAQRLAPQAGAAPEDRPARLPAPGVGDAVLAGADPGVPGGRAGAGSLSRSGLVGAIGPVAARPQRAAAGATRHPGLDRMAGDDPAMARLVGQVRRLADRRVNVLVHGETGAGKEVLARALHASGPRAAMPFVAINCASIPDSLIESELFGYTAGSFTGGRAKGARGLIQQADGGTLFLDEIGDMPLHLQTRLLRVLSEGEVLPLGAERPLPVDLAVVAATHRDLRERVAAGSFREDLYYRLAGATLHLPALRERTMDIGVIVESILAQAATDLAKPVRGFAPEAMACLLTYGWPGNIRELRNEIYRAVALCDDLVIPADALSPKLLRGQAVNEMNGSARDGSDGMRVPEAGTLVERLGAIEVAILKEALLQHRWNKTRAAKALGLSRVGLKQKLVRFGLEEK